MNKDEVTTKITEIFRNLFDDYTGAVSGSLKAPDVAQWDSLANVQLIVMIEQAFKVKFTSREIEGLANLGELIDLTASKA